MIYSYVTRCNIYRHTRPGRVVDILEACGAFDPGSSPGRGALRMSLTLIFIFLPFKSRHGIIDCFTHSNYRLKKIRECEPSTRTVSHLSDP